MGASSLETYLEGGSVAWATERQIELVDEALNNLRKVAPDLAERIPLVHKITLIGTCWFMATQKVNSTIVWQAATRAIPTLIPTMEAVLAEIASPD